eukprot:SAG31_NODE_1494_length_8106_cov_7.933183_3_plen_184_part_00
MLAVLNRMARLAVLVSHLLPGSTTGEGGGAIDVVCAAGSEEGCAQWHTLATNADSDCSDCLPLALRTTSAVHYDPQNAELFENASEAALMRLRRSSQAHRPPRSFSHPNDAFYSAIGVSLGVPPLVEQAPPGPNAHGSSGRLPSSRRALRVLDLGCGTGIWGLLFARLAAVRGSNMTTAATCR